MVFVDPRADVFVSVMQLKSQSYFLHKWSKIFDLCLLFGDDRISDGLRVRLRELEVWLGMDLFTLETVLWHSDALDNFIKVGGSRVTQLDIERRFYDIGLWLSGELSRIKKGIVFRGVGGGVSVVRNG